MGVCSSGVQPTNPDQVDKTHFDMQRVVGEGGFGKVKAAIKISEAGGDKGSWYAVKIMSKKVACKRKMTQEFFTERNMLAIVEHDFLCNARYCFQDEYYCYIVMDLALGGDAKYHCKHQPRGEKKCLDEALARFYFAQLAVALEYLHQNFVLHRDIKPENIVIAQDGYAKLTDFGISQRVRPEALEYSGSSGTVGYMAPEIFTRSKKHGAAADWFAAGCTLHYLVTGTSIFGQGSDNKPKRQEDLQAAIAAFPKITLAEGKKGPLPPDLAELLTGLLTLDPAKRTASLEAVRGAKWYGSFDWAALEAKKMAPPWKPDCTRANCELNEGDLEDAMMGGHEDPVKKMGKPTDEEQSKFVGYEWNVTCSLLAAGKREKIDTSLIMKRIDSSASNAASTASTGEDDDGADEGKAGVGDSAAGEGEKAEDVRAPGQ